MARLDLLLLQRFGGNLLEGHSDITLIQKLCRKTKGPANSIRTEKAVLFCGEDLTGMIGILITTKRSGLNG